MTVTGNKISHKLNPNGKWKQVLSSRFIEEVSLAMACTQVPEDSAIVGEDGQMHFFAKDRNLYRLVDAGMADTATAEMKPGDYCEDAGKWTDVEKRVVASLVKRRKSELAEYRACGFMGSGPYVEKLLEIRALEELLKQMNKA